MNRDTEHKVRVGIDIGGTFTDVVAQTADGFFSAKVPSTYPDPSPAVAEALETILTKVERPPESVGTLSHGTTVATNAAIERNFATVGLLTTAGFRDVLAIGRQMRPELYNLDFEPLQPLVPRHLRGEIDERMDYRGEPVREPRRPDVIAAARRLVEDGAGAICVCLLNSYANPAHEDQVAAWVSEEFPDVQVWRSSRVVAEFREYERFSTTALNAALGPAIAAYLTRFEQQSRATGVECEPTLMHSAGGISRLEEAAARPTSTLLSGPAAGVLGAARVGSQLGADDLLTFDMGGTSSDLSVVRNGHPEMLLLRHVEGYPVMGSTLDIDTIGAGGGSIAWIDSGGRLRVGPRSAGARPGPAAYGTGGTEPTVTDAYVVTGLLPADVRLGQSVALDHDAAVAAMRRISDPLGLEPVEGALALLEVVNTNMALAARRATVARGIDPRGFTLVGFGGAGPLHAIELARRLEIGKVAIPANPGTMCAIGLLVSDLETEFARTRLVPVSEASLASINDVWAELTEQARSWIEKQPRGAGEEIVYRADLRYAGQDHTLPVPVPAGPWRLETLPDVVAAFREQHVERNGYAAEGEVVEIVNFRVVPKVLVGSEHTGGGREAARGNRTGGVPVEPYGRTPIWWSAAREEMSTLYRREDLSAGVEVRGPALIMQEDTTLAIPPDAAARVEEDGTLLCTPRQSVEPAGPARNGTSRPSSSPGRLNG